MKDVMVDLETFGTGKDAVVCQIGACYFDRVTGAIGDKFKVNIDARTAVKSGAEIDADTVYWWLSQGKDAISSITSPPLVDITTAFEDLNKFLAPAKAIWSHATFDFVIIAQTLRRLGIKPNFRYTAARDIRTLMDLAKASAGQVEDPQLRLGTHHDALDDCIFQVLYCVHALNRLKK